LRNVMHLCIGSQGIPDGRYAEIDLPATPYRLLDALDELGIKSTEDITYKEVLDYIQFCEELKNKMDARAHGGDISHEKACPSA
jgi:hypothetical protein